MGISGQYANYVLIPLQEQIAVPNGRTTKTPDAKTSLIIQNDGDMTIFQPHSSRNGAVAVRAKVETS